MVRYVGTRELVKLDDILTDVADYEPAEKASPLSRNYHCCILLMKTTKPATGKYVIPDLTDNNITAKSPQEKPNMLNSFFKANFTVDGGIPPSAYSLCEIDDSNLVITVDGVLKLLNDIQVSKSCGPDNITGILLKTFFPVTYALHSPRSLIIQLKLALSLMCGD